MFPSPKICLFVVSPQFIVQEKAYDLWIETKNSTPTQMPIEVSAKAPRTGGVLGPSYFPKWGWYQKLGWNLYTWKERGGGANQNWFSQEFRPTFGFAFYLHLPYSSYSSNLLKSCKSCELIPSFAHFMTTFKLGIDQGLQNQTRAQVHGDFNSNC